MTKNVLLLTIDSLRADHLRAYGYDRSHTPNIDDLLSNGVKFESAFATGPGTTPSFPAMLTGTLPLSYGGLGPLTDDRPRVAEQLGDAGLRTGGFQCNPFLSEHFNYDRGFDEFEDYQNPLMGIATKIFPRGIELNNPKLAAIDDRLHLTDAIKKTYQLVAGKPRPYVSAEVVTDDVLSFLDSTDEPFFCWGQFMDVHHPCHPPEPYRREFDVEDVSQSDVSEWYSDLLGDPEALTDEEIDKMLRLYDAAIAYVDDQVGRIVEHLRESGRFEDTLVVLTSDHGELFGEHGQYGKPERMYDELLHVPLVVVNGSDHFDDAADDLVSLLDVPPLVHDALGADVPDAYEGRRPGVDPERDVVLAEHEVEGDVIVAARSRDWLYESDEIRDEDRLFDLRDGFDAVSDPAAVTDPGAGEVQEVVHDRLRELDVSTRRLEDEVEGDVEDRLADLGYL